jgi:sulfur carrier protein ThiS
MSILSISNFTESAHLILDKPLVAQRIDVEVPAGQRYTEVLKRYITKPGVAYVVLVDGVVVDQNEIIQPGVEIRCVPQIIGG